MPTVFDQVRANVSRGPYHETSEKLPDTAVAEYPVRLIAYYLPQFHAIPENDAWWGAGFTDWNNVVKTLPRYVGHRQPRLPADLGFYDLSNPDTIYRQAALARRAGLFGFCIHDYWFSGRKVLEKPLQIILQNRDIDIRFCLNWANENWSRRWDGSNSEVLLAQRYEDGDAERYAESILPAVTDPRYIKINGRPLIMMYQPAAAPDARRIVERWRYYFTSKGIQNPYVVMAQSLDNVDPRPYGMDAAAAFPPHGGWKLRNDRDRMNLYDARFRGYIVNYDLLAQGMLAKATSEFRVFPGVCPDWDNSPRNSRRCYGLYGATPLKYGQWLKHAAEQVLKFQCPDERIVFINAWNEWAEGAYLEPDQYHGYAYLVQTRRVIEALEGKATDPVIFPQPSPSISELDAYPSGHRVPFNWSRGVFWSVLERMSVLLRR